MKTLPLNFPYETIKYIIPDEDGFIGTFDAKIRDDAPQWAKDEYEAWKETQEKAKEKGIKL